MPRLECRGAALATLISRIFESILVLIYMYKIEDKVKYRIKDIFSKTSKYWLPIEKLSDYRAYPTFFRDKLQNIKDGIEHIVTYE